MPRGRLVWPGGTEVISRGICLLSSRGGCSAGHPWPRALIGLPLALCCLTRTRRSASMVAAHSEAATLTMGPDTWLLHSLPSLH